MAFTENLDAFFNTNDFAVSATFGATTGAVIFDTPDQNILSGEVTTTEYRITYKSSLFTLNYGDTITVDGNSYKVRSVDLLGDGKISRAFLTKL